MNNKLVVVTDLGSFKAYKLETNTHSTPRLELIEEFSLVDAHGKMMDDMADLAGRSHAPAMGKWATPRANDTISNWNASGGWLNKWLTPSLICSAEWTEGCYLAAGKEINHQIIAELPREARVKIEKIVAAI